MKPADTPSIQSLFDRERLDILVMDSGLGGLSVFARIAAGLKRIAQVPAVSMIYFNAWPSQDCGYNRLADDDERIRVLDRALVGAAAFRPDVMLIACNTLSVLYDRTAFSRYADMPVVDIIDFGVDLIHEKLATAPGAQAVILGTLTTIVARTHFERLTARGIDPGRIVQQPCDQLATQIEKGPRSERVSGMIDGFMQEAAKRIRHDTGDVYAALCCTHFGYCEDMIQAALKKYLQGSVQILNPNEKMAELLLQAPGRRCTATEMDLRVVSRIHWDDTRVQSIAGAVAAMSPETAEALRRYEQIPDLFTF